MIRINIIERKMVSIITCSPCQPVSVKMLIHRLNPRLIRSVVVECQRETWPTAELLNCRDGDGNIL